MARIKYQPSTRVKPFNPIQLSKEGITQMRRDSDRKIRGMEQNFQAEKEQQARDRAAMQENAALEQDRIKRDREIEIENLKNEQTALSQQANIDRQQAKFDSEASNAIFESISSLSQTAASFIEEAKVAKLKEDTKKAQGQNLGKERESLDQYYNNLNSIKKGTVAFDADVTENAVLSGEERWQTTLGHLSNPGRNFNVNQINANTLIKDQGIAIFAKAFNGTDRIYTDSAGNKFSGVEAYNDPIRNRIVTDTEHKNFVEKLGLDYAAEGYLSSSSAELEKVKDALAKSSVERSLKKSLEIGESKLKILRSGTAENIAEAWDFESVLKDMGSAWESTHKMTADPTNSIEMLSEAQARIMGVPMKEYNKNPEKYSILNENHLRYAQTKLQLAKRNENIRKANEANLKFRKAQYNEYFFVHKDSITAAVKDNPILAERTLLDLANKSGFTLPAYATSLLNNAKAELEIEDTDRMNFEYNNSKLTPEFINNSIKHPTVKKAAIKLMAAAEEKRFGKPDNLVKKGYLELAKKAAKNAGSRDISGTAFLIEAKILEYHDTDLSTTGDPLATKNNIEELYYKAVAERGLPNADVNNIFYQKEDAYNNIVYPNIENPKGDPVAFREVADFALKKYGADVRQYPYSVETQAATDITIESYKQTGTPRFSINLINNVDSINKSNPDKKRLTYSEYFNEMQKAKSSISGEYHPIIENTFSTQTLDSLSPAQAKLQSSAHHFSSNILAKRNTINSTAGIDNGMTLRSMTRGSMGGDAIRQRSALQEVAGELGVDPIDLATIIGFETGGTYDPGQAGGEGGNYSGLIQFGGPERDAYGVTPGMTFEEQLRGPVLNFFKDRFAKAGMSTQGASLEDLYTTVLAGNPAANRNAEDSFGTSALSGVSRMGPHREAAIKRFGF